MNYLRMPVSLYEWVEVQKHLVLLKYRNSDAAVNVSEMKIIFVLCKRTKTGGNWYTQIKLRITIGRPSLLFKIGVCK
jgi:hypothetical protein